MANPPPRKCSLPPLTQQVPPSLEPTSANSPRIKRQARLAATVRRIERPGALAPLSVCRYSRRHSSICPKSENAALFRRSSFVAISKRVILTALDTPAVIVRVLSDCSYGRRSTNAAFKGSAQNRANLYAKRFRVGACWIGAGIDRYEDELEFPRWTSIHASSSPRRPGCAPRILAFDACHRAAQSRPAKPLGSPFPPLSGPSAASARRVGPSPAPESSEAVNRLFPQACVNPASFPRLFGIPPPADSPTIRDTLTSSRSDYGC